MFGRVGLGVACCGAVVVGRGCRSSVGVICVERVGEGRDVRCCVRICVGSRVWLCCVEGQVVQSYM